MRLSDKEFGDRNNSLNYKEHDMLKLTDDSLINVNAIGSLEIALKNAPTVDIQETTEVKIVLL